MEVHLTKYMKMKLYQYHGTNQIPPTLIKESQAKNYYVIREVYH